MSRSTPPLVSPVATGARRAAGLGARVGRARAFARYLKDPSASKLGKAFLVATVLYVVWPLDIIPDVPVVGWLDDLGVFSLASAFLWSRLGKYRDLPADPATPPSS